MDMNTSKAQEFMLKLFKYAILTLFSVFIIYLLYLSGFSTSVLTPSEHTYLIGDSFWFNVLFVCVVISAFLFLYKNAGFLRAFILRVNNDYDFYAKCRNILFSLYLAVLMVYVVSSQRLGGVSDRTFVFNIAYQWTCGDFSAFYDNGYLFYYPHQLGLIIFLYYFSLIFGGHNYIAFEICNVFCVILTYKAFADLSDMAGNKRFKTFSILLACILFLPMSLYTTFAYGTLLGLCLAVNSVRYIYIYISDRCRNTASSLRKCFHLVISLGELFLAVVIKQNYLIFAIGYIILCCIFLLRKYTPFNLMTIIAAVLIVVFSQKAVDLLAVRISGYAVPDGMPPMSWVDMGLNENDGSYDGWWTPDSRAVYKDSGFDRTATKYIALEHIQHRVKFFISDPEYAVRFFSGKNASQWNNPEFNAYFVNNVPTAVDEPEYLQRLFSVSTMDTVVRILNPLHFAVLAGAVFYLLLKKDKSDVSLFFCVVFVGGFMFHTVWEAKGQYTLPFFTLLLPLAVEGYAGVIHTVLDFPHLSKKRRITVISSLAVFIVFGAVICWGNSTLLNDIFVRSEDTESYISYLNDAE